MIKYKFYTKKNFLNAIFSDLYELLKKKKWITLKIEYLKKS